jgi:hypothetical protein
VGGVEVGVETLDLRREDMRSFTVGGASLSMEETLELSDGWTVLGGFEY